VIVPSRYLGRWVESLEVPEQHIRVIYNAIELAGGHNQVQVHINAQYKIVTVGRLVPWKGIDEIIDAVTSLTDVGLVVVGDGPERAALEQRVEQLDLFQRVFFAGARSHHETMALMKACDVFVLNSKYEGLPHIVLEAMALGLPVVATRVGGTPEVVQDGVNGLLVPAGSAVELQESLKRVLKDDTLRTEIIAQGYETVSTKFSPQTMVNQTENALSELIISVGG
jgi:glycosyltransferase involved in cell wall biosynthesis